MKVRTKQSISGKDWIKTNGSAVGKGNEILTQHFKDQSPTGWREESMSLTQHQQYPSHVFYTGSRYWPFQNTEWNFQTQLKKNYL